MFDAYKITASYHGCFLFVFFTLFAFVLKKMSGCRIFIGRLNPSAREKDVERFFKGYGRIRDIDLKRGFGFVVRFAFRKQFNKIADIATTCCLCCIEIILIYTSSCVVCMSVLNLNNINSTWAVFQNLVSCLQGHLW